MGTSASRTQPRKQKVPGSPDQRGAAVSGTSGYGTPTYDVTSTKSAQGSSVSTGGCPVPHHMRKGMSVPSEHPSSVRRARPSGDAATGGIPGAAGAGPPAHRVYDPRRSPRGPRRKQLQVQVGESVDGDRFDGSLRSPAGVDVGSALADAVDESFAWVDKVRQANAGETPLAQPHIPLPVSRGISADAQLAAVAEANKGFAAYKEDPNAFYLQLLHSLLILTNSSYGFIAEIVHEEATADAVGTRYLRTRALTNISWDAPTREAYDLLRAEGFQFKNMNTLFGITVMTGETVIANDVRTDPRAGGLPPGHPPLNRYCGIPFYFDGEMIGMVGIANRPGGYTMELSTQLEPFLSTIASVMRAQQTEMLRAEFAGEIRDANVLLQARVAERTKELLVLNEKLQREVDERKAAQLRAEEAARARGLFLAKMSHELRTPMAPAIGLLDMLAGADNLTEDQHALVRTIQASSHTMLDLVNSILDFTKGGTTTASLNVSEVAIYDEVQRRESLFRATASDHGIEFATEICEELMGNGDPVRVRTDAVRFGQLLSNLCSNAIKFAKSRVQVVLSCWDGRFSGGREVGPDSVVAPGSAQDRGFHILPDSFLLEHAAGRFALRSPEYVQDLWQAVNLPEPGEHQIGICLSVVDDGDGIERSARSKLFDAFVQGSDLAGGGDDTGHMTPKGSVGNLDRHGGYVPGTGLGLSICRELAILLKGRIALESIAGTGTAFSVLLPMDLVDVSLLASRAASGGAGAGRAVTPKVKPKVKTKVKPKVKPKATPAFDPLPDSWAKLKYMIVDDNGTNRKVLQLQLTKLGIPKEHISLAEDGLEAIHAQEVFPAHVIFMDLSMPRCGGEEATRRILAAAAPWMIRPRIVALTANVFASEELHAEEVGFSDIVTKPTKANVLRATIMALDIDGKE